MKGCGQKIGPFECCTVIVGDCLDVMAEMPQCVDLAVADPPFNIGKLYGLYKDNRSDYWEWTSKWQVMLWKTLKNSGACYFKNQWQNLGPFDLSIRKLPNSIIKNVIVWQKGAGLASKRCYSMRWEAIWFVVKDENYIFNLDDIRVTPETSDKRNNPNGKNPSDCWYIPRVAYGSKARMEHPAQSPVALLTRIILASSNSSDFIFDPFLGSGTTAVVAQDLGRHFFGCDINPEYVAMAEKRLSAVQLGMGI